MAVHGSTEGLGEAEIDVGAAEVVDVEPDVFRPAVCDQVLISRHVNG